MEYFDRIAAFSFLEMLCRSCWCPLVATTKSAVMGDDVCSSMSPASASPLVLGDFFLKAPNFAQFVCLA